MTEGDLVKAVQDAGGQLVRFPRSGLLNMWGLRTRDEITGKLEALCEANGFEYRYDQATAQFRIRLKGKLPEPK